ncbi:MAG: hypothetical protein BAJALOKI2v1_740023 [Promethearchaeota archaeon]|nr:MAG: hypothetical protein BAJALOKI2v1_740023 [Candidatus Lokiarchaeota archaeon]
MEQKQLEDERRKKEIESSFSEEKLERLDDELEKIQKQYFFTSFILENAPEEIHEADILAKLMQKEGKANLDDIKKELDIPPIMATRTIKQLAVKEIINLDEDTNEITLK